MISLSLSYFLFIARARLWCGQSKVTVDSDANSISFTYSPLSEASLTLFSCHSSSLRFFFMKNVLSLGAHRSCCSKKKAKNGEKKQTHMKEKEKEKKKLHSTLKPWLKQIQLLFSSLHLHVHFLLLCPCLRRLQHANDASIVYLCPSCQLRLTGILLSQLYCGIKMNHRSVETASQAVSEQSAQSSPAHRVSRHKMIQSAQDLLPASHSLSLVPLVNFLFLFLLLPRS